MPDEIITYVVKNPSALERINESLNKIGEYGFCKGDDDSDALCFFNKKNIFAIVYKNGRVELAPSINPLIVKYIEKELNSEKFAKN